MKSTGHSELTDLLTALNTKNATNWDLRTYGDTGDWAIVSLNDFADETIVVADSAAIVIDFARQFNRLS